MSESLLDLTAERRVLEELLERSGGDLSDPSVALAWDANCLALVQKVDAYAVLAMDWKAKADHLDDMADQLKAKANAIRAGRERLLERAKLAMGEAQELQGETYRIVRRKNPASVVVTDEAALKADKAAADDIDVAVNGDAATTSTGAIPERETAWHTFLGAAQPLLTSAASHPVQEEQITPQAVAHHPTAAERTQSRRERRKLLRAKLKAKAK